MTISVGSGENAFRRKTTRMESAQRNVDNRTSGDAISATVKSDAAEVRKVERGAGSGVDV